MQTSLHEYFCVGQIIIRPGVGNSRRIVICEGGLQFVFLPPRVSVCVCLCVRVRVRAGVCARARADRRHQDSYVIRNCSKLGLRFKMSI